MRSVKADQTARMRRLICLGWSRKSYCRFCRVLAQLFYLYQQIGMTCWQRKYCILGLSGRDIFGVILQHFSQFRVCVHCSQGSFI